MTKDKRIISSDEYVDKMMEMYEKGKRDAKQEMKDRLLRKIKDNNFWITIQGIIIECIHNEFSKIGCKDERLVTGSL